MTREDLRSKWGNLRATLAEFGPPSSSALCSRFLADLEELWASQDDAELTLDEAAEVSGYSTDHLRRLVRTGRLSAHRVGRRLFFKAGDLPRKPLPVDRVPERKYDPIADARQVTDRRNRGGSHGTQEVA